MINNAGLTFVLLAIAFAATLAGRFIVRRFTVHFRPIAAYEHLGLLGAEAIESDLQLHLSIGEGALGSADTISALTAAEVAYRLADRAAIGERPPLLTLSSAITLPLAQDTLRRAYEVRRKPESWRSTWAAWYPPGLPFAGGAASLATDRLVDHSVVLGRWGAELALLGEGALRADQQLTAHSDRLEGQAIAVAQAGHLLLGEDLYAGPAYLKGNALQRGGLFALETLRWLVILAILVEALVAVL